MEQKKTKRIRRRRKRKYMKEKCMKTRRERKKEMNSGTAEITKCCKKYLTTDCVHVIFV